MAGNEQETDNTSPYAIGGGYNNAKVLASLIKIDIYIREALFGFEQQELTLQVHPEIVKKKRIEALGRLKEEIKLLFENTAFGIKKQWTKKYNELSKRMNGLDKYYSLAWAEKRNEADSTRSTSINEKIFKTLLAEIRHIKQEMMTPLNESGFIFFKSENQSLENMKDRLKNRG